ncbi:MAG: hypothetical protein WA790_13625 [Sulfitobacter sp.]
MARRATVTRRLMMIGALAALSISPAIAQTIDIGTINGLYTAEGRNPDGSAYSGSVVMAEVNGAVQINWTVGNQHYAGTGVRDGQIVVVNWGAAYPVIYVVMADGNLHGTWDNGKALERLIRK